MSTQLEMYYCSRQWNQYTQKKKIKKKSQVEKKSESKPEESVDKEGSQETLPLNDQED